jgi:molybdopterin adenylyltransferase
VVQLPAKSSNQAKGKPQSSPDEFERGADRDAGGPALHRARARKAVGPYGAAVITVSSTRDERTDNSGAYLKSAFEGAGHRILFYRLVKDDLTQIHGAAREALATPGVDIVVSSGGTGMTRSDLTIQALLPLLEKQAVGWGDVFRALSLKEIGPAAFLTQTLAGTVGGKWLVAIPGSLGAAKLAMEKILLPELEHMLFEAMR